VKTTLADWKKDTVRGLLAQRRQLSQQIRQISQQTYDLNELIAALTKAKLTSKATRKGKGKAPKAVKSRQAHWSKKPGADPKKVAAWKATMSKVQKAKAKNGA